MGKGGDIVALQSNDPTQRQEGGSVVICEPLFLKLFVTLIASFCVGFQSNQNSELGVGTRSYLFFYPFSQ